MRVKPSALRIAAGLLLLTTLVACGGGSDRR
jgi:hypothetical protein